jgi:hypothetical protein
VRRAPGDTIRRPPARDTIRTGRDTTIKTVVPIPPKTRADSAKIDSVRGIPDTTRTKQRADSIQPPLAVSELPPEVRVGRVLHWTRDSIFTTGAITLADLLERVPGITTFRTGWLASAQTAAYLGDFRRVRVFRDGVEMDAIDPRNGGAQELLDVQLWQADEITVERAAGEIRVYVRTWTTRNTTAYTRVDVATGDEDTNLYRGFYGKRWGNGLALQVGAQQYGTGTRNRLGGGGDALDAVLRLGWARRGWSVDGYFRRLGRTRDVTVSVEGDSLLPGIDPRRNEAYFRLAYGNPDRRGPWVQAIASALGVSLGGTAVASRDSAFAFLRSATVGSRVTRTLQSIDSLPAADSSVSRTQYVLTGGYTLGAVRLSVTDRLRATQGSTYNSPSVRLAYDRPRLTVSALGEWGGVGGVRVDTASIRTGTTFPLTVVDTTSRSPVQVTTTQRDTVVVRNRLRGVVVSPDRWSRLDLAARLSPLPWLAVQGGISRESRSTFAIVPTDPGTGGGSSIAFVEQPQDALTSIQGDVAARLGRAWFSAGVIRRGATGLAIPTVYGGGLADSVAPRDGAVSGVLLGAQGKVYGDVYVDVNAVSWGSAGPYRPQYQGRFELGVATNWLNRFPSGNLGIHFALIDEYRSRTQFRLDPESTSGSLTALCGAESARCAPPSNMLSVLLEIRIQKGTLWYQLRNALNREYALVPGFTMPRPINVYGVRWEFWN